MALNALPLRVFCWSRVRSADVKGGGEMMMISKKMWEFTVFCDHGCGLYDIVDFLDDLSNATYDQWYIFFVLCRVHTRTGRVAYSFDAHGEPVNPLPPAIV
ncbi:unnamed protein product, partial [Pylaiella littoralis]